MEAVLVRTGRVNSFGRASELRPTATAAIPDVVVFFQILEDWVYEGIKWQLRDTDRYSSTVRLTQCENPSQLLALAVSLSESRSTSLFTTGDQSADTPAPVPTIA